MFKNRQDAAQKLADQLIKYQHEQGVVMGVPRGGIPIAYEIAQRLDWPLDIVLSKKIGHPNNKEYAIGAVSLTGRVINQNLDISHNYLETEAARIRTELQHKYNKYMDDKDPHLITGKTLILTDDGVATGHTLLSTIELLWRDKPAKIIVAIPVSAPEALRKIEARADEVICLAAPVNFRAVGQFYDSFEQTTDQEVMDKLHGKRYSEN